MILLFLQTDSASIKRISENSKEFLEIDPLGIGMTAIGMAVVFASLLLLYILFMNITRALNSKYIRSVPGEHSKAGEMVSSETNAAIAYALYLYLKEKHDEEDAVLTINRVSRSYSPWSSKIYGLRQYPR